MGVLVKNPHQARKQHGSMKCTIESQEGGFKLGEAFGGRGKVVHNRVACPVSRYPNKKANAMRDAQEGKNGVLENTHDGGVVTDPMPMR